MTTRSRLLVTLLAATIALPAVSFAAKGDAKTKEKPTFASLDKDSDGIVTESEFLAAAKGKRGEEAGRKRFGSLDKNNDGKLSKEEFNGAGATGEKKRKKKDRE